LPLDRVLFSAITRRWDKSHVTGYFDSLQKHDAVMSPAVTNSLQTIDTKAAGLLTHVAMMIAGLGLIAPLVVDSRVEMGVIICEMGLYMLVALGCLRCLSIFHSQDLFRTTSEMQEVVNHELILRRELYGLCNRAAIGLTILVFLLLPVFSGPQESRP
jgi:hypothetical protein